VTGVDFDALFDRFEHTAFRLEARPSYDVGGEEAVRIAAFRERRPRPERGVRTDPWLRRIAVTTSQGKVWRRLRLVDDPLTDYERYQLLSGSYQESLACGDETVLLDRGCAAAIGGMADFWLFDGGTPAAQGFFLLYTPAGQFSGITPADAGDLRRMQEVAERIAPLATPLSEFLAGLGVGVA
jgi:hypothetical protein